MRRDTFLNTFLMSLASLPGQSSSQALTAVSVPSQCSDMCRPIVELTNTCDVNMEVAMPMDMSMEEMKAEMDCICKNTSFDVKGIMGLCASCMEQNAGTKNKTAVMNVEMIMSGCSFPTTSYAPSATSKVAGVKVEATKPVMTMTMWNNTEPQAANTNKTNSTSSMGGMSMGGAGMLSAGMAFVSAGLGFSLLLAAL